MVLVVDGSRNVLKANIEDAHVHVFAHLTELSIQAAPYVPLLQLFHLHQKRLVLLNQPPALLESVLQEAALPKGDQQFIVEGNGKGVLPQGINHT